MMSAPSNPRLCQHSMVADLCGLCIRDQRIEELENQRTELIASMTAAANWIRNCSTPIDAARELEKATAKHRRAP